MKTKLTILIFIITISAKAGIEELSPPLQRYFKKFPLESTHFEASSQRNSDFKKHYKSYHYNKRCDYILKKLLSTPIMSIWNGPTSYFEALMDNNQFYTKSNKSLPSIEEGSIIFLKLKIAYFLEIPVAFKITTLDPHDNIIEFYYLKQNISKGRQQIAFNDTLDNGCQASHTSFFSSGNKIRDFLYPYFHEKLVDDFHRHIKELVLN